MRYYILDIIYDGTVEPRVVLARNDSIIVVNKAELVLLEKNETNEIIQCPDIRENPDKEDALS